MKTEKVNGRTVLVADEGKVVTNGEDICGKKILLAVGVDPVGFYEKEEETAKPPEIKEDVLC